MKNKLKIIFSTLKDSEKLKYKILIVLGILGSILEILSILMIFPTLELIFNFNNISNVKYLNYFTQNLSQNNIIAFYIVLIISLFIFKGFFLIFIQKNNLNFFKEFEYRISSKLFSKYLNTSYKEYVNFNFAQKIRNINEVVYLITILTSVISLVVDSFLFFFVVVAMLIYNFKISLIIISSAIIFSFILILYTKKSILNISYERREKMEGFYSSILNALNSLKEIIILNRQNYFLKEFTYNKKKLLEYNIYLALIRIVPKILIEIFLVFILLALIFYFYISGAELKEIFVVLSFYTISGVKLIPSFSKFIVSYQMIRDAIIPAEHVAKEVVKYSNEEIKINNRENSLHKNEKIIFENTISLSNVSFKFENGKDNILENIDLEIFKSQVIGIIGKSGSGKSTLINILMGLYEPTKGKVLIDNTQLREIHKLDWFSRIGYVPQEIYLINDTIKKNITFGVDENKIENEKLEIAINQSNLKEFLDERQISSDINVGEKAIKISGGQSQRVVIARALYNNPEILILDEATSRLDEANEYQILDNITKKLKSLKTIIIISHRPETLKKFCDKIYEVKNKKINLI